MFVFRLLGLPERQDDAETDGYGQIYPQELSANQSGHSLNIYNSYLDIIIRFFLVFMILVLSQNLNIIYLQDIK